jgi:hypothetical protein
MKLVALFVLGVVVGVAFHNYRADQGFVKSGPQVYRMTGMQNFGIGGIGGKQKFIAVYEKE